MSEEPTILVVEDSADDVLFIRRAFGKAGLVNRLRFLSDGESAIAFFEGAGEYGDRALHPLPGLVLLDLKLPRRSGFEVLERLRSLPDTRRTPVVVLTSSAEERDVGRAYDLGANSYLVKPVAFDELLELARRLDLYWLRTNRAFLRPAP